MRFTAGSTRTLSAWVVHPLCSHAQRAHARRDRNELSLGLWARPRALRHPPAPAPAASRPSRRHAHAAARALGRSGRQPEPAPTPVRLLGRRLLGGSSGSAQSGRVARRCVVRDRRATGSVGSPPAGPHAARGAGGARCTFGRDGSSCSIRKAGGAASAAGRRRGRRLLRGTVALGGKALADEVGAARRLLRRLARRARPPAAARGAPRRPSGPLAAGCGREVRRSAPGGCCCAARRRSAARRERTRWARRVGGGAGAGRPGGSGEPCRHEPAGVSTRGACQPDGRRVNTRRVSARAGPCQHARRLKTLGAVLKRSAF